MIQVKKLSAEYVQGRMPNHDHIQDDLIRQIRSARSHSIDAEDERVSFTDLRFRNEHRPWIDTFYKNIDPYLIDFSKQYMHRDFTISNCWFMRYQRGDFSDWHVHENSSWASVYFLKLPSPSIKTSLLSFGDRSLIPLDEVQEGDIISFPSCMIHCSKPNPFDEEKIVIAFNTDFSFSLVHNYYRAGDMK